jgi:hypothetical protein
MPVLDCLDGITEDLRLLVTQDGDISPGLLASNDSMPHRRGQEQAATAVKTPVPARR